MSLLAFVAMLRSLPRHRARTRISSSSLVLPGVGLLLLFHRYLHRPRTPHPSLPIPFPPAPPNTSYKDASALSVPRALLQSPLLDRILVSPSHRVVFCPIPGAEDHQIHQHLSQLCGPLHFLSAFAPRDRERLLHNKDVFRFAFVIHPFTRLLASYFRGTRSPGGINGRSYRTFMSRVRGVSLADGQQDMEIVSFQFFLTYLNRQDTQQLHDDFRSQSTLCGFREVNYTFVGRMERFERDMASLYTRIGAKGTQVHADAFLLEAKEKASSIFQSHRLRSKAIRLYETDLHTLDYSSSYVL